MTAPRVFTYSDAVEAVSDFLRGQGASASSAEINRAIRRAYNELTSSHDWACYQVHGRVHLHASQAGTATYTNSTRVVTLEGGDVWPTTWNAIDGSILPSINAVYILSAPLFFGNPNPVVAFPWGSISRRRTF